jgi:hypothetical protein
VAQGLTHALQSVQGANGRQHMGGVGALAAAHLEEAAFTYPGQQGVEQQLFGVPRQQPRPELAQHGMVEARVGQLQAKDIFPINAAAHRIGRLAV